MKATSNCVCAYTASLWLYQIIPLNDTQNNDFSVLYTVVQCNSMQKETQKIILYIDNLKIVFSV